MKLVRMKTGVCPHCGAPKSPPSGAAVPRSLDSEVLHYDLEALAAEAAVDKVFDENARIRVTQQDIRKLLDKRRKGLK
jgi:hypothetical protein